MAVAIPKRIKRQQRRRSALPLRFPCIPKGGCTVPYIQLHRHLLQHAVLLLHWWQWLLLLLGPACGSDRLCCFCLLHLNVLVRLSMPLLLLVLLGTAIVGLLLLLLLALVVLWWLTMCLLQACCCCLSHRLPCCLLQAHPLLSELQPSARRQ
jgi:hypothetical protein